MHITVNARALKETAAAVARTVPRTPQLPVLTGLHLATTDTGQLAVHATDGQVHTSDILPVDVHESGVTVVSARLLTQYLQTVKDGPLVMETVEDRLTLRSGRSTIRLRQMALGDMPSMPTPAADAPVLEFTGGALERIARQVGYATDPKDSRPIFGGVQFRIVDGQLTCAATDSYRLAVTDVDTTGVDDLELLLPAAVLDDAARAASADAAATIQLICDPALPTFRFPTGRIIVATTINGAYPDVQRLLPDPDTATVARISRTDLLDSVARVTTVQLYTTPRVTLTFTAGQVEVSAADTSVGTATESVTATYAGNDLEIAFNPSYLKDALTTTGATEIDVELHGPTRPVVLRVPDQPSHRQLIMPLAQSR